MSVQRVYVIHCPNNKCPDYTALPLRSLPEKFGGPPNQAKDIWPITYLCLRCKQLSVVPDGAIHRATVETRDQSQLIRYDFSNGPPNSAKHCRIYAKGKRIDNPNQQDARKAIERILKPSGLWKDSNGTAEHVSIDFFQ